MSRTFFELAALVLVSFALGLLVGWLAWSNRPSRERSEANRAAGTDDALPRWQVEQARAETAPAPTHRQAPAEPGPTVVLRPGRDLKPR